MEYPEIAKNIVFLAVKKWYENGMYPPGWKFENQLNGAHAECAAFILRFGTKEGIKKWYSESDAKRKNLGNNPLVFDGYDMKDSEENAIDVKWIPSYNQIWVTESTHRTSNYRFLVGIKFDEKLTTFEAYRVSKEDFDKFCSNPRPNKLKVDLALCEKIDSL